MRALHVTSARWERVRASLAHLLGPRARLRLFLPSTNRCVIALAVTTLPDGALLFGDVLVLAASFLRHALALQGLLFSGVIFTMACSSVWRAV